jgi:hypothetical protein
MAGEPIAAADRDYLGAGCLRALPCAVATAAVGNDDAINDGARQRGHHRADRFRFVEGWDDDRDGALGSNHP